MFAIILFYSSAIVLNVVGQEFNATQGYDPADILSNIFHYPQNEAIQNDLRYQIKDVSQDVTFRNEFKRKKRRRPQALNANGFYGNPYTNNYNGGHFYERPSFATEALSQVTEALTSIALYDDFQCVPRLLCEAAGGGALGSSNILQSVNGLQPLFTLLSAYSGVRSNPLFIFGRAVLLGMSSKEKPESCRNAYPLCPTDPERLVHYLNNHNGGFFRFFNSPQKGQNIQQFYNHLQGNVNYAPQNGQYGLHLPNNPTNGMNHYQHQNGILPNQQGYGLQRPYEYQQNYGFAYPYNGEKFNKIQKRIQNNPSYNNNVNFDSNANSKWIFPMNTYNSYNRESEPDNRRGKELKFPENTNLISEDNQESEFTFPNTNRGYDYIDNNYYNNVDLYKKHNLNDYNADHDKYKSGGNDYITVYVVRGNGDPNKPEIVKLRPGQTYE